MRYANVLATVAASVAAPVVLFRSNRTDARPAVAVETRLALFAAVATEIASVKFASARSKYTVCGPGAPPLTTPSQKFSPRSRLENPAHTSACASVVLLADAVPSTDLTRFTASSEVQRARWAKFQYVSPSLSTSLPFCCSTEMPNDPVEPPGKTSRAAAAPVYDVQLSASARSRPEPLTSDGSAEGEFSASARMGPGLTASSAQPDSPASRQSGAATRSTRCDIVARPEEIEVSISTFLSRRYGVTSGRSRAPGSAR